MARFRDFSPGTKVRLSGKHLRSTGQVLGLSGSRVWTVLAFPTLPHWVVVDEESAAWPDAFTPEERAKEPSLQWRRIAKENLVVVGQCDSRDS